MKETGYSFHYLTQKFDAGSLFFQEKISIIEGITCRQLQIEIARAGANKLHHVLSMKKDTTAVPMDISNRKIKHCLRSYEISSKLNPLTSTTDSIMQQIWERIGRLKARYSGIHKHYTIVTESDKAGIVTSIN